MDPQHELRVWIGDQLREQGYGAAQRLADYLNVEPHTVSRMKNTDGLKETRRIEADMIPKLVHFFGCIPPGFRNLNESRCRTCLHSGRIQCERKQEARMEEKEEKPIKVEIHTPQQGTLVVGDNNTVTTHDSQNIVSGTTLSPEHALKLDNDVKQVAAARSTEPNEVWEDLCKALDVAYSALITREVFHAAEKILSSWKGRVIYDAVNKKRDDK